MNKERAKQVLENEIKYRENEKAKWESVGQKSTYDDERIQALDIAIDSLEQDRETKEKMWAKQLNECEECEVINNEWVDVRDRLPINDFLNLSKDVLICNAEGEMFVAYYDYKKQCWRNNSKVFYWSDNIIAWKPLPQPYERKEQVTLSE